MVIPRSSVLEKLPLCSQANGQRPLLTIAGFVSAGAPNRRSGRQALAREYLLPLCQEAPPPCRWAARSVGLQERRTPWQLLPVRFGASSNLDASTAPPSVPATSFSRTAGAMADWRG
jgi:hypothetical protein